MPGLSSAVGGLEEDDGDEEEEEGEDRADDRDLPAVRQLAARTTPEEVDRCVERTFRKDAALARKVRIYFYHRHTGQSLKEIGNRFGVKESGVSQASRRFSDHIERDSALSKKIDAIKAYRSHTGAGLKDAKEYVEALDF